MNDEEMRELLSHSDTFCYRLLGRMKADCEYYLGNGNRHPKHLWASTEKEHIDVMEALWNNFSAKDKPEWLTLEQIEEYKKRLLNISD